METCTPESPDGEGTDGKRQTQRVFRDPRSEEAAERAHARKCQLAFDRAVSDFNAPKGRYASVLALY